MALHSIIIRKGFLQTLAKCNIKQVAAAHHAAGPSPPEMTLIKIGSRDVVGYGINGEPIYFDKVDIPMPAIRFKECTPEIQILREKEKGDWSKLSIEEKKVLYRASFCQTFAEVKAPTGEWKGVLGLSLIGISLAFWIYLLMKLYVYPPMPHTFEPEYQKAMLKRMIDLRMDPVTGIGSKWDYEQGKWK